MNVPNYCTEQRSMKHVVVFKVCSITGLVAGRCVREPMDGFILLLATREPSR